jgi:hypothetical protein
MTMARYGAALAVACACAVSASGAAVAAIALAQPLRLESGPAPQTILAVDVNRDRAVDLLTTNGGDGPAAENGTVSLLRNDGGGGFGAARAIAVGGDTPFSLAHADFDHDGRRDLASANLASSNVSILLKEAGSTYAAQTFDVQDDPKWIAAADFDGDGHADVATAHDCSASVSILLGNGDGTLDAPVTYAHGGACGRGLAAGDLSGDGRPELVLARYTVGDVGGAIDVLLNDGAGHFAATGTYPTESEPFHVAITDLDGDADLDAVVAEALVSELSILLGTGAGAFVAADDVDVPLQPMAVAAADLDADGLVDVAAAGSGEAVGAIVLRGHGDASFGPPRTFAAEGGHLSAIAAADLDGDGKRDLATASSNVADGDDPGGPDNTVSVLFNTTGCTKVGTHGSDRIVRGAGDDVVCALGGNDYVSTGGGKDTIFAGAGSDEIRAADGNDIVYARDGRVDVISGGWGWDRASLDDDDERASIERRLA